MQIDLSDQIGGQIHDPRGGHVSNSLNRLDMKGKMISRLRNPVHIQQPMAILKSNVYLAYMIPHPSLPLNGITGDFHDHYENVLPSLNQGLTESD